VSRCEASLLSLLLSPTARILQGMAPYPGQARCLALGLWPECFRRLNVKGWPKAISEGNAKRP
jgi:hypothetical protein